MTDSPARGLRERKKAQTRQRIQEQALRLFLDKGYDATTVQEVAAAAEVSHMTLFRHFRSKEALVESDDYDPMIAKLIRARPATSTRSPRSVTRCSTGCAVFTSSIATSCWCAPG